MLKNFDQTCGRTVGHDATKHTGQTERLSVSVHTHKPLLCIITQTHDCASTQYKYKPGFNQLQKRCEV